MITPVQATIAPGEDQGVAETELLDGIPKPIASRPASRKPTPAINSTAIIEFTPRPRPKCAQAAYATIPSYCAHRQPAIAGGGSCEELILATNWRASAWHSPAQVFSSARLLHCIREITPQLPITWKRNCAIWMPGNEAQKRQSWARRDAGLPIAMSSITTSAIDTPVAALGGADLRRPCHPGAGRGRG